MDVSFSFTCPENNSNIAIVEDKRHPLERKKNPLRLGSVIEMTEWVGDGPNILGKWEVRGISEDELNVVVQKARVLKVGRLALKVGNLMGKK